VRGLREGLVAIQTLSSPSGQAAFVVPEITDARIQPSVIEHSLCGCRRSPARTAGAHSILIPQEDAMTDIITVTGLVATSPRHITTSEGLAITSFRLASNQRRFDRGQNAWVDGDTNWYTITAFRQLGVHAASSIEKGQRVIVTGRVRVRDWESGEKSGTTIEIDAEAIGHDLTWGRATFTRSVITAKSDRVSNDSPEAAEGPAVVTDSFVPTQTDSDDADARRPDDADVRRPDGALAGIGSSTPF